MDPVTLTAPSGAAYTTTDPVELNNLVYGHGYRQVPQPDADTADQLPQAVDVPAADVSEDRPQPPPRSGAGSGTDRWREYAERLGVATDPEDGRDDVVQAIEDAGHPVE